MDQSEILNQWAGIGTLMYCKRDTEIESNLLFKKQIKSKLGNKRFLNKAGLSMNILCAGDKSPVQRGFFTNSMGALGSLGGLYNFCNFAVIFSLI